MRSRRYAPICHSPVVPNVPAILTLRTATWRRRSARSSWQRGWGARERVSTLPVPSWGTGAAGAGVSQQTRPAAALLAPLTALASHCYPLCPRGVTPKDAHAAAAAAAAKRAQFQSVMGGGGRLGGADSSWKNLPPAEAARCAAALAYGRLTPYHALRQQRSAEIPL